MEHSSKYKTKGVRSSDPFQKESIPLNKISWEVSNDKKLISLTSFKFLQEKKYDDENLQLGIYAYDTANDFLLNINLNEIGDYPIKFNIKNYGFDELGDAAKFEVYIFDSITKQRIAETSPIRLVPNYQLKNLLEVKGEDLGKRIAHVDITSSGPVLKINKKLKTKKGYITRKNIESIIESNPIFMCSFFPQALDKIFSYAFLNKGKKGWTKDWIDYAEDELVPGAFKDISSSGIDSIDKLEEFDKFQDVLTRLSDAWIKKYNFDNELLKIFNNT